MNVVPVPIAHYCGECCSYYAGTMDSTERLAEGAEEGTPHADLEFYTEYYCADPRGACSLVEGDFHYKQNLWQCGECEEIYEDMAEAMDCCGDGDD